MSKKVLILLIAGVLVLAGGGVAAVLLLTGGDETPEEETAATEPPGLLDLESFVVNLSNEDVDRYAKLHLKLAVQPPSLVTEVRNDLLVRARIRDRVISVLASKPYEELVTPLGRESLRREILAKVGPLFEGGEIEEVLFSEFVVQ